MEKKIFLIFFLLFSGLLFSQEKYKIELHNKAFESSFVYSINSNIKSDFKINIVSTKNKIKLITKTNINVIGEKFFKIDVSTLKKGNYYFKVLDKFSKVIFEKKIKKI